LAIELGPRLVHPPLKRANERAGRLRLKLVAKFDQ
jgi:hypothetical protein